MMDFPVARSIIFVEEVINPHRQNRLAHNHLGNLGARANKAAIFHNHRIGLQRFQNPTNTGTSRNMNIFADLRA